jgi:acetate kinase
MPKSNDAILVLNGGSSSIKLSAFAERVGELALEVRGEVEGLYTAPRFVAQDPSGRVVAEESWPGRKLGHDGAIEYLSDFLKHQLANDRLVGVGHRVVHGGLDYTAPVRVEAATLKALERFIPLAPLHQPHNLLPIALLLERAPELPQVACFDTSFHRTNPDVAQRFALPTELHDAGVRRYGFHGLSYEYIASEFPRFDAKRNWPRQSCCTPATGRACAPWTRDGASPPRWVSRRSTGCRWARGAARWTPASSCISWTSARWMHARSSDSSYTESGLLGLSGISSDMRSLLASAAPSARLAVDVYVYRIRRELGSLAAALGGLDSIVFTGGIGEHAPAIRERVCHDAAWLGIELDAAANARGDDGSVQDKAA